MRRQYSNTQNAVWNTIDLAALRDIGADEVDREAYYLAIRKFLEQAPEGIRAEGTVIMELIETATAEETNLPGYDVPMALLVAGSYQVQPPLEVSFDLKAFWETSLRHILLHLNDVVLKTPEAIAIFELNVAEYPDAPNPYDSLGDAYSATNRLEVAKASYKRAVELAEAAEDPRLAIFRENLGQAEQLLLEQ